MNEPYQRVSQDNGVMDGSLIGAAVAAGGAGAGVFGTRMHYNGIDNRVKKEADNLKKQYDFQMNDVKKAEEEFGRQQNKNPNFLDKRRINRGNQAEEALTRQGGNARTMSRNKDIQRRNKTYDKITSKLDKKQDVYTDRLQGAVNTMSQLDTVSQPGYGEQVRSKHAYSKMGGWKNAGIIGASAVVGGAIGLTADSLNN